MGGGPGQGTELMGAESVALMLEMSKRLWMVVQLGGVLSAYLHIQDFLGQS